MKNRSCYKPSVIVKLIFTVCTLFVYLSSYSQSADDSTAVVKLLEKAATTFRSGDAKGYADCWQVRPYSTILISTDDGKAMSVPAEAMVQPSQYMGQGGSATATNYKMAIHGDSGWTSFDEVSTAKDGTKTYSYEIWMVEKISGKWKLVGASMHFYKKS